MPERISKAAIIYGSRAWDTQTPEELALTTYSAVRTVGIDYINMAILTTIDFLQFLFHIQHWGAVIMTQPNDGVRKIAASGSSALGCFFVLRWMFRRDIYRPL